MTVGKTTSIEDALHSALAAVVLVPVRPVAWPNQDYKPAEGSIYLEPLFLIGRTESGDIGGIMRRHVGIYQIMVHGPVNSDQQVQTEIADLLVEYYHGLKISRNGVLVNVGAFDGSPTEPWRSAAIPEKGWLLTPVSVPWYCDTFN